MTTTEALDQLSAAMPDRTVSAHKEATHHRKSFTPAYRSEQYVIFVQPGFDGEKCQLFTHLEGFDKPVADCLALAKSVAATENNE
jgi:hypothetical protein